MEFRIADTFTDSLAKLNGDEQKAVKSAAFDLQLNPAHPALQFHKLDKAKDPHFWSVRVSLDIRPIVHRTESSLLLCYVNHHDNAYHWAERRKLETHPKTGAAQLVEIRETVREIAIPKYLEVEQEAPPKAPLFAGIPEEQLLGIFVIAVWIVYLGHIQNLFGQPESSSGHGARFRERPPPRRTVVEAATPPEKPYRCVPPCCRPRLILRGRADGRPVFGSGVTSGS